MRTKTTRAAERADRADEPIEMPAWSADCTRDATLIAWAIVQVAEQINNAADAIDALYGRLDGIEQSLDLIGTELPNAGKGS